MNDVVLDLKLRSSKAERFNKPRRRKANLFGRARPCGVETGKVEEVLTHPAVTLRLRSE